MDRAAAVSGGGTAGTMTLHNALIAVALGDTGDVHVIAGGEHGGIDLVADIELGSVVKFELFQDTQSLAGLLAVTQFGFGELALGDFIEAQLNGNIAVLFRGLFLHDGAGACLNDSDRDDLAGFIEDLGHTQLLADNGLLHSCFSSLKVIGRAR